MANWSYDGNGNISAYVHYNGNRTTFSYDLARNLETSRTEGAGTPLARTITTEWHPDFRLPTKITEPNRVSEFEYDSRGNLIKQTVTDSGTGASRIWRFQYGDDGQVTQTDGPRNDVQDVTTYDYDDHGNLRVVINAAGHRMTFSDYDDHGRPREIKDPNGLITTLEYDERGRLTTQQVGEDLTKYEYDGVGQLIEVRRPDGGSLSYTYDAAHRLTDITDNLGNTITYTLDLVGNQVQEEVRDSAGNLTRTRSRTFDEVNRLASSAGAEGQRTSFGYDRGDNLVKVTDPLGHSAEWSHDALDRLMTSTEPPRSADLAGAQTRYEYEPGGDRLTKVTAAAGQLDQVTAYTYDGLDNQTSTDSPDAGLTEYAYDKADNMMSRMDARGQETTYAYDQLNRIQFIGGEVTFRYDEGENGLGRLTRMDDPTGTTQWTYDAHGRVTSKTQQVEGAAFVTRYEYYPSGRLESIFYPSGRHLHLDYASGQLKLISANGLTLLRNIEYEPFGPASRWIWGDNNETPYSREFDPDGRLAAYPLGGGRTRVLEYDVAGRIEEYRPLSLGKTCRQVWQGWQVHEAQAITRPVRSQLCALVAPAATSAAAAAAPGAARRGDRADRERAAVRGGRSVMGRQPMIERITVEQFLERRKQARQDALSATWHALRAMKGAGKEADLEWIKERVHGSGVDSDLRLEVFLICVVGVPPTVFWDAFHDTWCVCDATWRCRSDLLIYLRRHHAALPGPERLSERDRAFFASLPDPVEVYRGCSRPRVRGVSWTTNRAIAAGFAGGHRGIAVPAPVIASAAIPKAYIFSAFTERDESELVLDPRRLRRLAVAAA